MILGTDNVNATCEAKKNAAHSIGGVTVFDLSLDYARDDGWNGCAFQFTAAGYSAEVTAGVGIGD